MFSFVGNLKLFIMEAKGLRIGNYVLFGETFCKVEEIQEKCFYATYSDGSSLKNTTCNLQPIPLTEEILLKCGYATCSFRDNHFVIKGHTIWKCKDLFMCDKNGMVLKYLHQLQNLYFALTNEELTVNL